MYARLKDDEIQLQLYAILILRTKCRFQFGLVVKWSNHNLIFNVASIQNQNQKTITIIFALMCVCVCVFYLCLFVCCLFSKASMS